jgi:peptidoglycan/xylan/chitin deacetylase (PgdA/CDA1 family)
MKRAGLAHFRNSSPEFAVHPGDNCASFHHLAMLRLLALSLIAISALPVPAQTKTVYLTFDDGPQTGTTDVLDVLKEHGAHAAFFLTGSNGLAIGLETQGQIVKREIAEGHEVGSHCYIHLPMKKSEYTAAYGNLTTEAERKAFDNNFARNLDHFRLRLGQPDFTFKFARLPGDGFTFPALVKETESLGMRHFAWQFEYATGPKGFTWLKALDWQGVTGVRAEDKGMPEDGAIILFHDRHWGGENKAKLSEIIGVLKKNGYTFGKLADVKPRPVKVPKTPATPAGAQPPVAVPVVPAAPSAPAAPAAPVPAVK